MDVLNIDNGDNRDNKSLYSVESYKEKQYDTIPFRIDFINDLLAGKKLEPIVNFHDENTEQFVNPNGFKNLDEYDEDIASYDTTNILNKKLHNFYEIIKQIGGKLLYVKSGTTGHTFKGIINDKDGSNMNYAVKVVAFPKREKYGDISDIRRPENAEIMMIRLLSYFVIKRQTPHIVLPIGTFNTSIKPFINLIDDNIVDKENKKYHEFAEKYKEGQYHDQVSILISEWANRGDLLDFIRKNHKEFTPIHWKVFFFQVISVLAIIQNKYPGFRHNDLKANNILVHKVKKRGTYFSYTVNRCRFILPSIGYQIKLWDFDFACIPGIVNNKKVSALWTDEINVKPVQNRYYDMHYFFNTLIKKGFFPQLIEDESIPQEIKDFINRIVPPKLQENSKYVSKRGRILIDKEYLTPDDVLKNDPYFEEFRNFKLKSTNKSTSINNKMSSNLDSITNTTNNINIHSNRGSNMSQLDKLIYDEYKKNIKK